MSIPSLRVISNFPFLFRDADCLSIVISIKKVMFLLEFVCLSVCQENYQKMTGLIFIKLGGNFIESQDGYTNDISLWVTFFHPCHTFYNPVDGS